MRLFVAVWPPPAVVRDLTAAVAALPAQDAPIRWVPPEQLHLTLAFLGAVPEERRPEVERRLARVAERYPALTVGLAGAGRFGDRVLYARLAGDRPQLGRLAASVGAAARRSGLNVEDRPFRAHLTLARARPPAELRPLAAALDGFRADPWPVAAFDLVESRLGAGAGGRPVYRTVASWPLTA